MKLLPLFRFLTVAIVFVISLSVIGCKKTEGPGGTSTIQGKIIVHDFDAAFQSPTWLKTYPSNNQDAYIIYGADHATYDNNFKTSYDGSYEFKYLQKGNYRLFAYSKDSTGAKMGFPSGLPVIKIPVFVNVEITSNGSTVNAPDIIVLENKQ